MRTVLHLYTAAHPGDGEQDRRKSGNQDMQTGYLARRPGNHFPAFGVPEKISQFEEVYQVLTKSIQKLF